MHGQKKTSDFYVMLLCSVSANNNNNNNNVWSLFQLCYTVIDNLNNVKLGNNIHN